MRGFVNLPQQLPDEHPMLKLKMRRLWFGLNNASYHEHDARKALHSVSQWMSQDAALQPLKIGVYEEDLLEWSLKKVDSGQDGPWPSHGEDGFVDLLQLQRDLAAYQLNGVKRRLDSYVRELEEFNTLNVIPKTQQLVAQMHEAFRGELWFNEPLCYKDQNCVAQPFVQTANGWRVIAYENKETTQIEASSTRGGIRTSLNPTHIDYSGA
jgi:hypothetical protein